MKYQHFSWTWPQMIANAERGLTTAELPSGLAWRGRKYSAEFYGTLTLEEAISLARNGWTEGATNIKALSDTSFSNVSRYMQRPEPAYGTEGLELDIGRFLDGEPECYLRFSPSEEELVQGHKTSRIYFNQAVSAGVKRDVIDAKGATVAALIRLLDYAGIRCEVTIGSSVKLFSGGVHVHSCRVKESSQDLDFALLAFQCAHIAAFRRIMWASMETVELTHGGNGYPEPLPADLAVGYDIVIGESHFNDPQWENTQSALEWIYQKLSEQGVTVNRPQSGD